VNIFDILKKYASKKHYYEKLTNLLDSSGSYINEILKDLNVIAVDLGINSVSSSIPAYFIKLVFKLFKKIACSLFFIKF